MCYFSALKNNRRNYANLQIVAVNKILWQDLSRKLHVISKSLNMSLHLECHD